MDGRVLDPRTADLARLRRLPPHDLAEILYDLNPSELAHLFTRFGDEDLADLVAELDPHDAGRLILKLSLAQAADVLEEMPPDDAADVVEELSPSQARAILQEMEPDEARQLKELLAYPEGSAGHLMTPKYVAVSPDMTAEEALVALRHVAEEAESVYYVYVKDPETNRLLAVLPLYNLFFAKPQTPVRDIMNRDVAKVRADAPQEEAARLLNQYHFIALPVVDDADRLLGIITADDAAAVLREEATEDIERLGGSQPLDEPYLTASPFTLARKRIGWLLLLFVAQAYTGTVMRHFQNDLQQVVALAFFIPLLIGTGGNTGSQTVTTVIRAMALGELRFRDAFRVWLKELGTAFILATAMALATLVRAWTLNVTTAIGLTVALAASAIVLWAATVAALLPLVLRRLRVDPAVVSAPLISTLVDGTGLIIYFEIARRVLRL
ncbi:MAG TPA: magnesium transporter [bacterium]|nr:magnesium transporter [bacterium]